MSDQQNKNLPTFNVGTVVHLGVQQIGFQKTDKGEIVIPLFPSPLMVVTEITKNVKDTFNEQTGLPQINEKVNCMYFNFKTALYEERWFPAFVLSEYKELSEELPIKKPLKPNEDTAKYTTGIKNLIVAESLKNEFKNKSKKYHLLLKSSFEYLFRENGGLWKERPNFDTPPMSLLDIVKESNKPLNKYDQKTGDQIRWTTAHEERAKCIWFNPLTGKYSEGLFILEALQMIDITKPKPQ